VSATLSFLEDGGDGGLVGALIEHLFSMRMRAKALRMELDQSDAVSSAAEEIAQLSESALADLRRLVFELRPLDVGDKSVIDAVRAHAASVQTRTGIAVRVHAPSGLKPNSEIDLQEDLYRIVQEALHNVVKHADAKSVDIRFTHSGMGGLIVEIPTTAPRRVLLRPRPRR